MSFRPSRIAALSGAIAVCTCAPSWASLVAPDGLTYTLLESTISPTVEQFTLDITGINVAGVDTAGGRYGVNAFAFVQPSGFVSASGVGSLATNFSVLTGGLSAAGCNMSGNFFCFMANTEPTGPNLAPSELKFTFDLTVANANDFAGFASGFKVDWLGTKSNFNQSPPKSGYNLVSQPLAPTPVPLPATLPLLLGGVASLRFLRRRNAA